MNKNVLQRIASLQLQGKNDHDKDFLAIAANDAETLKKWAAPLSNEERITTSGEETKAIVLDEKQYKKFLVSLGDTR